MFNGTVWVLFLFCFLEINYSSEIFFVEIYVNSEREKQLFPILIRNIPFNVYGLSEISETHFGVKVFSPFIIRYLPNYIV